MKTMEKLAVIVVLDVVMFSAALVEGASAQQALTPSQPNPIYRGDELQGIAIGLTPVRPEWSQEPAAPPVALRLRPVRLSDVETLRSPPRGSAPPPRQFSGLHMAFSQEWPQGAYEIGSSGQKPPSSSVRVVCGGCPAVNWALNLSPDSTSDKEKLMVNAATFGVILMAGNGRLTLLEWNP